MGLRSLLAAVTIALVSLPAIAAGPTPNVQLLVLRDGGVQIRGHEYRDEAALREKLKSLSQENPKPIVVWGVQKGTDIKFLAHAIMLVQDTKLFPKMAFVIEPPQK